MALAAGGVSDGGVITFCGVFGGGAVLVGSSCTVGGVVGVVTGCAIAVLAAGGPALCAPGPIRKNQAAAAPPRITTPPRPSSIGSGEPCLAGGLGVAPAVAVAGAEVGRPGGG